MKIAVIGANGNLGTRVTQQALDREIAVKGFIRSSGMTDTRMEIIKKSLFDMTEDDIKDCDVVISAYGSGFKADPKCNYQAFLKYIELCGNGDRHLIVIGGAGSLFTDEMCQVYCYETPEHPDFLRDISKNIKFGIDELKKTQIKWTVVCPSLFFDPDGPFTGNYEVGTEGHLIFNDAGESRVTYDDLACAMLDIAQTDSYQRMQITVLTK